MGRIPFIVFGDGPRIPSGLARIARDLTARLVAYQDELGIRVAQVGVDFPGGWHWQGWDFMGFQPCPEDQGRGPIRAAIAEMGREEGVRPIVLMIMDPARCWDLTRTLQATDGTAEQLDASFWGYFPIDAENLQGAIGGPAAHAVYHCTRVLAYGAYGQQVLRRTLDRLEAQDRPVAWLPHGIETRVFRPTVPYEEADPAFLAWRKALPPEALVIGCVATNQARKDLGLLFTTVQVLQARFGSRPVALWLHTDKLTHSWDVGELAYTTGIRKALVAASTGELVDAQLAAQYALSHVTIAPGLGEGFGYPIVESLACGTPVVHGHYAGGVSLVPEGGWLVPPAAWRLESIYAVTRPVFSPTETADAVWRVLQQRQRWGVATMTAYCAGSVQYLDWEYLWPRWRQWIEDGVRTHDGQRRSEEPV